MELLQETIDPQALTRQIEAMLAAGRTDPARHLLAAVRRLTPQTPELSRLSARLAIREGRQADALAELDAAIATTTDSPALYKARASLRSDLQDNAGAVQDAAEAVLLDRHDEAAKALLGILLLEFGAPAEAVQCLVEAVRAEPANPYYGLALARAEEACGAPEAAIATLGATIEANPARTDLRTEAVLLQLRRRDFAAALAMAETACRLGLGDACLFGLKAHALSSLERHEEAAEAYGEALKLGPNDPYVQHIVAAAGLRPGTPRAPTEYLRAVFDGYADRFEQHLVSLGYRVPGLIRNALIRQLERLAPRGPAPRIGPVLDLGCGTGLLALVLAELPLGPMTGVDVSAAMLAEARAKNLYAELRDADILSALAHDTALWPVILAGDVLCYFGELGELFAAVRRRLEPGGIFVFSVESNADDRDWRLSPQGRYSHRRSYVERTAAEAGLSIRELAEEALRFELAMPVDGLLVVLEHPPC